MSCTVRRHVVTLALAVACGCGGGLPTGPTPARECRRYPTSYGGIPCRLETGSGVTLRCSQGFSAESWTYISVADFVEEAAAPYRPLLTRHGRARYGMVGTTGSSAYWRRYRYDGRQRLVERIRGADYFGGTFPAGTDELDRAEFTDWDAHGRPILGTLMAHDGTSEPVTIFYDDERRWTVWSTGESQLRDADGILVNEVEVFVSASGRRTFTREYEVLSTAEVCK